VKWISAPAVAGAGAIAQLSPWAWLCLMLVTVLTCAAVEVLHQRWRYKLSKSIAESRPSAPTVRAWADILSENVESKRSVRGRRKQQ
jgi:hypothetical protein